MLIPIMHKLFLLPLLLACVVVAHPAADELALEARQAFKHPPKCSNVTHIIACSGASNPPHGYGLLSTLVESLLTALPGSSNYSVPYPKMSADPASAAMIGVQHMTENLEWYIKGCPQTPLVLLGYSLGAIVTLNTLCGRSHIGAPYAKPFPSKYAKHIIATVLYGDESRVPYQSYDYGTCTHGYGVDPRGDPSSCHAFASNFHSYCDDGDELCCGGHKPKVHKSYPRKYNNDSTSFIVSQYYARVGKPTLR